ncbi:hypothetical protein [Brevibacillus laterosporus]|uniref:hypothetical protein n=1 Tax=Brevibacillus laterosporus TaxID=1465 RepID=UPI00264E5E70|nr:hypothetical protein [Brevibacillus laterosporus]MDN9010162.1 hypothetical protein [Brevibacillus laterosporus]MDO0941416.1 hypothetical protein [Brevibacillus laterosporus]
MEIQQLIEAVTNEVISRLDTLSSENKQKIIVISAHESEWLAIKPVLNKKFDVYSVVTNDVTWAQKWPDDLLECNVQSFAFILITGLHCCALASLALGLIPSKNLITQALLQGKKVYLIQEGLEHRQFHRTAPAHLYDLYQSYEQKLVSFGVTLIKKADIHLLGQKERYLERPITQSVCKRSSEQSDTNCAGGQDLHANEASHLLDAEEKVWHIEQRVISESVLKKLCLLGAQSFTILPNAILTPLAKDFVRMNQLTVKKTKQEGKPV